MVQANGERVRMLEVALARATAEIAVGTERARASASVVAKKAKKAKKSSPKVAGPVTTQRRRRLVSEPLRQLPGTTTEGCRPRGKASSGDGNPTAQTPNDSVSTTQNTICLLWVPNACSCVTLIWTRRDASRLASPPTFRTRPNFLDVPTPPPTLPLACSNAWHKMMSTFLAHI